MTEPEKPIRVLELKTDPRVAIPFILVVTGIVAAAVMGKISVEMAGLILMALGVPSIVGVKTVPQLVSALVTEMQKQFVSLPPPGTVPPPPTLPTGTEHPTQDDETTKA